MTAPALELRGVSKRFGGRGAIVHALDGIDLALGGGEIAVVLGPTGAGKTTLLRTIAGLERPDAGRVQLGGADVTERPPAARDVALVFQNFSLYPGWSVRANLEFPLRAPGRELAPDEIARRVQWAAERLRIAHLLERDSRRLSGGEMQRVAIGRAIVRRPRLFLMDEPLTNLDAKLREALRVELAELVRELAIPMVYVTHDQAEALSMADRVHVLVKGRILQRGTPREVYLHPSRPEVARLLGSPPINEIAVRLDGSRWVARSDGTPLLAARGAGARTALLGVRPEHVALAGGPAPAEVLVVEHAGHQTILVARFAGQRVHLLAPRDTALRPGDRIQPLLDPERVVVWREE